jgi:hypothetical protein
MPAASSPSLPLYICVQFMKLVSSPNVAEKPETASRRADSNRLPLLQLRVINGTLQAFASGSKTRISKPVQFLCPARCCTVVCSRRC